MPPIHFTATPITIGTHAILRLPKDASAKFPSRGMAMAAGSINGTKAVFPLEPDGKGSHWFVVEKAMKAPAGKPAELEMDVLKDWPEPEIPADMRKAIETADPKARATWVHTTPMARWDWIRWIRSTNNPDTRAKRITVACSKLKAGMRRPCCFNRSMCTDPSVSKGGVLLEPENS